jgi:hypothetical protein
MTAVTKLSFRKGERRKYPGWRAFTVVTGNITRAGVMVEFDPDPIDGRPGGRQFADTQWVAQADAVA